MRADGVGWGSGFGVFRVKARSVARVATRKYLMVLGLIFAGSLVAFWVFETLLDSQVSHQVVNVSGRQRMLTHRTALYVSLLERPADAEHKEELKRELQRTLDELAQTQETLRREEAQVFGFEALLYGTGERYRRELSRLDYAVLRFLEDARMLLYGSDVLPEAERERIAESLIARVSGSLADDLERFVSVYEAIGRQRVEMLHIFAVVGEAITVLLLVIAGAGVFRPLVRDIGNQIAAQRRIETYYRAILDNVGDSVIAFDRDMKLLYVNATFAAQAGASREELANTPALEVLPEIARFDDLFVRRTRRFEFERLLPDGRQRHFDASVYIFEFGGEVQCIVSLRDITERKNLEDRLRLFFHGIENSPLSIVITDTGGVIQYANRMAAVTSGYDRDEIVGSTPRIFRSGETPAELYQALWANLRAGRSWYGEILNRRKNGELYWEYEAISALRNADGETTHFLAIKEDVTEKKKAGQALEQAKLQAEVANRAKSEFLANMSHELRTPLNAIIGFAEVMSMELFGPHGAEEYRDYSRNIHDSARHLLGIINEILDYSKIEANKVALFEEFISLGEVLDSVCALLKTQAENAGLTLVLGPHVAQSRQLTLHVDVTRLKQILLNLVTNGIKFTPQGGTVEIDSRMLPDGSLDVLVRDTGIGMKPEDIPRALERFGQVDATLARKHEGTGLGLPIARALAELHGGTLALASVEGEGTTAIVHLPARRVSFDPSAVPATAPNS